MRVHRESGRHGWWLGPLIASVLLGGGSCGGAELPSPDEPMMDVTRADLAGPLCSGRRCECKEAPDDAGLPAGIEKRYEVRVGPIPGEMWVKIGEDVLYKSRERSTECFYLDLEPGEHTVAVRAREEAGLSAAVKISEMGSEGPWWYDTFKFSCGAPGRCTLERLQHWKERFVARAERNILDHCGSTAIRDLAWRTGRARDRIYPTSMYMRFTLDVYSFTPEYPPGHSECAR